MKKLTFWSKNTGFVTTEVLTSCQKYACFVATNEAGNLPGVSLKIPSCVTFKIV